MAKTMEFKFEINANLGSNFSASFGEAGKMLSGLEQKIKDIGLAGGKVDLRNLGKNVTTVFGGKALSGFGQKAMTASRNIGSALLEISKDAISFEDAMSDVRKVVDFDTPQQFKEMGDDIIELSKTLPMTTDEIAAIVAAGGQSGIAREDLLGFAESAAKMGIAFDTTADQAGDMMAKWRTAFKMNQKEVESLADKVNYLGNTSAASAGQIAEVVTRIGPLGEVGGLAAGEVAALGSAIVGTGKPAEIASTGIKNLILGLTAGESATNRQKEAFAKLGFSTKDLAKAMQEDAQGSIMAVLKALQGLDKDTQAATLKDLFGSESIEALSPLLTTLDSLENNFNMVGDASQYAGSMEGEYSAKSKTTKNALKLAENNVKALKIAIGNDLIPAMTPLIRLFSDGASLIGNFAKKFPGLTAFLGGAAVGVAGFVGAVGAISSVAGSVMQVVGMGKAIKDFVGAAEGIGKIFSFAKGAIGAFSFLVGPIGLVIAGLVALGAVGYVIYQNWGAIKEFFVNLWNGPIAAIGNFILEWNPLFAIPNLIYQNWGAIKEWFVLLWNDPAAAIQTFIDGIYQKFGEAFNWLKTGWDNVRQFFSSPITAIVNTVKGGGVDVAQNASGGIYGKGAFLTTFAEESGESAIPHTPSARNIGLLAETNRIMGNPLGGGNVSINFNPTINVSGDGNVAQEIAKISMRELKRMLQEIQTDGRRVAYA